MPGKLRKAIIVSMLGLSAIILAGILFFAFRDRQETADFAEAQKLYASHDFVHAKKTLIAYLRQDRSNPAAFRMLAEILESEFSLQEAARSYQQAVFLDPLDLKLRLRYAALLALSADHKEVIQSLRLHVERRELDRQHLALFYEAIIFTGDTATWQTNIDDFCTTADPLSDWLRGVQLLARAKPAEALAAWDKIPANELPAYLQYRLCAYQGAAAWLIQDFARTEAFYSELTKMAPALGAPKLADFLIARQRIPEAIAQLQACHRLRPADGNIIMSLAEAHASQNHGDELQSLLEQYSPATRYEAELLNYLKALHQFISKHYDGLWPLLDASPSLSGRSLHRMMRLAAAVSERRLNELPNAITALKQINDTPEAQKRMVDLLDGLMQNLYQNKELPAARQVAAAVIQASSNPSPALTLALTISLHAAISDNDYRNVETLAARLLKENPDHQLAILAMGNAALAAGRPQESLLYMNKLPPDAPPVLLGSAIALDRLGQTDEALKRFRQAHRLAPQELTIIPPYADCLIRLKLYDELLGILPALPSNSYADYLRHFLAGQVAQARQDDATMRREFQAAASFLAKMPDTPAQRYQQAFLLARADRHAEAATLYRELLKSSPEWVMVLINLSELEALLGNSHQALLLAEKAARLEPKNANVQRCLERRQQEKSGTSGQ